MGGVQDAVIAEEPCCEVETVQAPMPHPVVLLPAGIAAGEDEVHVRVGLGAMHPWTSTAVATIVSDVPLLVTKLVCLGFCDPFSLTESAMHCTGQVSARYG